MIITVAAGSVRHETLKMFVIARHLGDDRRRFHLNICLLTSDRVLRRYVVVPPTIVLRGRRRHWCTTSAAADDVVVEHRQCERRKHHILSRGQGPRGAPTTATMTEPMRPRARKRLSARRRSPFALLAKINFVEVELEDKKPTGHAGAWSWRGFEQIKYEVDYSFFFSEKMVTVFTVSTRVRVLWRRHVAGARACACVCTNTSDGK